MYQYIRDYLNDMREIWLAFRQSDEGQGLVEYALIIALVAIVLVLALSVLSGHLAGTFSTISAGL